MRWSFSLFVLAALALPASAGEWFVSQDFPGWDVERDAHGRAIGWFHQTTHVYKVWNGAGWEYKVPPAAWTRRPQVDSDAVRRRGNRVERIVPGTTIRDADDWTAMPADDSGKWHVYIVYQPGEAMSAKLRADWLKSPNLLAFAKPGNMAASWAHFNEYANSDTSQFPWRFSDVDVSGVPVVIIQPPIDGSYGDPRDVAFQTSYRGDPRKLAAAMSDGIRRYIASGPKRQPELAPYPEIAGPGPMPFSPKPKPEPPVNPAIPPAPPGPTIPPDVSPLTPMVQIDWMKWAPYALAGGAVLLLLMRKPAPAVEAPKMAATVAPAPKRLWGAKAKQTAIMEEEHPVLAMMAAWDAKQLKEENAVLKTKQQAALAAAKLADVLRGAQ